MRTTFKYCLEVLFLAVIGLWSFSAWAKGYAVTVVFQNQKAETRSTTCYEESKVCFLTLIVPPTDSKPESYINAAFKFTEGAVTAQFSRDQDYLTTSAYSTDTLTLEFDKLGLAQKEVTLFLPHPQQDKDQLLVMPVIRNPGKIVAELEIFIRRFP